MIAKKYREGKVPYLDYITSINELLDARIQNSTAYFDSLQALSKKRYYEGTLYDSLLSD